MSHGSHGGTPRLLHGTPLDGFQRPATMIAFTAITVALLSAHLGGTYLPITADELEASSMELCDGKAGIPGLPE